MHPTGYSRELERDQEREEHDCYCNTGYHCMKHEDGIEMDRETILDRIKEEIDFLVDKSVTKEVLMSILEATKRTTKDKRF